MSTAESREFYTPESYLEFLETTQTKYEFVDGYLRAMSSPTNRHNIVATNATVTFGLKLKGSTCRAFNSNSMVRIRKKSSTWMYLPDMSIVCDENRQSERFQDNPIVVVEVLSPSTRAYDLDEKLANYLTIRSLQMVLLLEQDQPLAIVFRKSQDANFVRETYEGMDQEIHLPFLGISVLLSDLYDGVEFPPLAVHELSPEFLQYLSS
jgi:Uma2 family endonuclease